jgi:hypothetical protein
MDKNENSLGVRRPLTPSKKKKSLNACFKTLLAPASICYAAHSMDGDIRVTNSHRRRQIGDGGYRGYVTIYKREDGSEKTQEELTEELDKYYKRSRELFHPDKHRPEHFEHYNAIQAELNSAYQEGLCIIARHFGWWKERQRQEKHGKIITCENQICRIQDKITKKGDEIKVLRNKIKEKQDKIKWLEAL